MANVSFYTVRAIQSNAAIPLGSRPSRSPIFAPKLEKREEAKTNERVTEYDRITRQETPMTAYDRADRERLMEMLINLPRSGFFREKRKRTKLTEKGRKETDFGRQWPRF